MKAVDARESKDLNTTGVAFIAVGLFLLILAGVIAFTASSLFVCIFFTGVMVMGAVFFSSGWLLRRIK